ncbi:hypothetical protein GCM10010869_15440 [Mesorhizobium tianshanense]|uniref:O-methyltransferase n=1 Tax=Mesorhizobium tianshanense TaxID=39844 RepID=A0A562MRM7_9HYPH|nr:TylF/MycF/NovP-related O-methyltransferase [Mesorhizobium tianshanense]TWI22597.1 O-methyltransferase [Mesorhizobium tianshanense]GLS35955.1 hypothetical protein GCM10010869_15440 [Mesorhizobium tianshanense]
MQATELPNVFLTNTFDEWIQQKPSKSQTVRFANKVLRKFGINLVLAPPVRTGWMTSVEQRMDMYHLASAALFYDVPGDFCELGCHEGKSAVVFQRILQHYDPGRNLHLYDSFEGLPNASAEDGHANAHKGDMATTQDALIANFKRLNLRQPILHQGWFEDTLPTQLPDKIAFAHLDGDLYDSVKVSLEYVYPRLSKGAACLIDDYSDPGLFDSVDLYPGVKKACDEFLSDKPEKVALLYGGFDSTMGFGAHGYFRKL